MRELGWTGRDVLREASRLRPSGGATASRRWPPGCPPAAWPIASATVGARTRAQAWHHLPLRGKAETREARAGHPVRARRRATRVRPRPPTRRQVAKLLRKQLKDRKEDKRIEASYALVDMKEGRAAVPALIEALHDTSREVRYNAAGALWNLDEAARPAI